MSLPGVLWIVAGASLVVSLVLNYLMMMRVNDTLPLSDQLEFWSQWDNVRAAGMYWKRFGFSVLVFCYYTAWLIVFGCFIAVTIYKSVPR